MTATVEAPTLYTLAAEYAYLSDQADLSGVLGLFTQDASFDFSSANGPRLSGIDEIRAYFSSASRPISHHLTSVFLVANEPEAVARVRFLVLRRSTAITLDYEWGLHADPTRLQIRHARLVEMRTVRMAGN